MAQQLQNITIRAPAFKGLNTQDSPIDGDPSFASVADNCIIDQYGRIGARKGFDTQTDDITALGGESIVVMAELEETDGTRTVLSAGNNKLFTGTATLTDVTGAHTITDDNWQMVPFNQDIYLVQSGYSPLVYNGTSVVAIGSHTGASGTAPQANCALGAFGRMWMADTATDKSTVYWSDLLIGAAWSGGTSGSINVSKVWPDGYDEITALAAHNDFLVIFGKRSIILYSGAQSPANMVLADTINGIGCVARDSVQPTGTDLIFLSHVGVQSLGRVIQEKSAPMRDISKNIRNDLFSVVSAAGANINSAYSAENAFYLLNFPTLNTLYCFDTRGSLEDGTLRVTRWPNTGFKCFLRRDNGDFLIGSALGIGKYNTYYDDGESYLMEYLSNSLSFGDASRTKILKKIKPTLIGGSGTVANIKWSYNYSNNYIGQAINLGTSVPAYFGTAQYSIGTYSGGIKINTPNINSTGNGTVVNVGLDIPINGTEFSIQELNIQALIGRML